MHDHHSHHMPSDDRTLSFRFGIAIVANLAFTVVQIIYAHLAHSSSLLADAGHNFGDVLGLLLAWASLLMLQRKASNAMSYGFKKMTILASVINAVLLVLTAVGIGIAAYYKLYTSSPIGAVEVMVVSSIGVVVNGATALLFLDRSSHDLNVKAAFLHLAYDALISLGVVFSAAVIYWTHWYTIDPLVGLIIAALILYGSWRLLSDSVTMMLDGVPRGIDFDEVSEFLMNIEGVDSLHDLHIWSLSTRENALTVHLIMPEGTYDDLVQMNVHQSLQERFKIHHTTIQVERCGDPHSC